MENTTYKLGKKAPIGKDSLRFGDFMTLLPNVPLVDTAPEFSYPMDLNDQYGDCVVAGFDHFRQTVTGLLTGTQQNFTTEEIEAFYKTQNPGFPAEDNGMDIQTFLEYLQANKHVVGFAKIDHSNEQEMKAAVYMGLAVITGAQLQQAQETQFSEKKPWDTVAGSPYIGGHCTVSIGYKNSPDQETLVTWGDEQQATERFVSGQMDEAWFVLLQEHLDHPTFRNHFNLAAFSQSVREITEGKIIIPVEPSVVPKTLLEGQIQVESGGNDNAVGDPGLPEHAYGCLQIRQPVCTDVNANFHTSYTPQGMLGNRAASIDVWTKYLSIYATQSRLGRVPTDEDRARIWNGGPGGWKESATLGYWQKVNAAMQG